MGGGRLVGDAVEARVSDYATWVVDDGAFAGDLVAGGLFGGGVLGGAGFGGRFVF